MKQQVISHYAHSRKIAFEMRDAFRAQGKEAQVFRSKTPVVYTQPGIGIVSEFQYSVKVFS